MSDLTPLHTDDCVGIDPRDECEPYCGTWLQPGGYYVSEAEGQLDSDAPWCRVHELAWMLQLDEEAISARSQRGHKRFRTGHHASASAPPRSRHPAC